MQVPYYSKVRLLLYMFQQRLCKVPYSLQGLSLMRGVMFLFPVITLACSSFRIRLFHIPDHLAS